MTMKIMLDLMKPRKPSRTKPAAVKSAVPEHWNVVEIAAVGADDNCQVCGTRLVDGKFSNASWFDGDHGRKQGWLCAGCTNSLGIDPTWFPPSGVRRYNNLQHVEGL